jgi:hypothetical protein
LDPASAGCNPAVWWWRGGCKAGLRAVATRDVRLLFCARVIRLFAYGALSVVHVLYLTGLGLSESQTGLLLS